ncbi:MAG: putative glycoside hydrolase [Clostridia bacterium]|nr:putative glycoside hydrolase [Clostridia bacterium]
MRKYSIAGILIVLGIVILFVFYAGEKRGPVQTQAAGPETHPIYLNQEKLRDVARLISYEEKLLSIHDFNRADQRPLGKEKVKAKGLYMSGNVFNSPSLFNNLVRIIDETELNAVVIDVKDDLGYLTAPLDIPLAREIQARAHKGAKLGENMRVLYEKNIYPIARIVVFKDPTLASGKTELAIKRADGQPWRDRKGLAWVDPHNREVWQYAVDVAKEAAKMGFREIQFDYVRFPTDGDVKNATYPFATGQSKEDVIKEFLAFAREQLAEYNVFTAADVFGLTTLTLDDMGMGQKYEKIIAEVDYVCPMVYPSHYGVGNYGFTNPNAYPYEVVKASLLDGLKKSAGVESGAIIRPWLQDFNLGSPRYGAPEVRAQIQATYDAGLEEWILWNAGNRYTEAALLPAPAGELYNS